MQTTIQVRFTYEEIAKAMERVARAAADLERFKVDTLRRGEDGHIAIDFVCVDELLDAAYVQVEEEQE